MDPIIAEFVGPIVGITIFLTGTLIGMRMWLHRPQWSVLKAGDAERLVESVDLLQEQVHQLRGDMADLHERIDFAERLLARGETGKGPSDRP